MTIAHNTMHLRGMDPPRFKFTEAELFMRADLLRRGGAPPSWYYDDSYDEPDPNAPTFWDAMLYGDLT